MPQIDEFRLRNLLNNIRLIDPNAINPVTEAQPRALPEISVPQYQPSEVSPVQNYRNVISQMPEREDYKPSMLRRVLGTAAAGITGVGGGAELGARTGSAIINKPYNVARESWLEDYTKAKGLYDIGEAEAKQQREIQQQNVENLLKVGQLGAQQTTAKAAEMTAEKRLTPEQQLEQKQAEWDSTMARIREGNISREEVARLNREAVNDRQKAQLKNALDIAEFNAQAAMERVKTQQAGAKERTQMGITAEQEKQQKVLPTQQQSAFNLAMTKALQENPQWREFIDESGNVIPSDNPELMKFINAVRAREREIISRGGYSAEGSIQGEEAEAIEFEGY